MQEVYLNYTQQFNRIQSNMKCEVFLDGVFIEFNLIRLT